MNGLSIVIPSLFNTQKTCELTVLNAVIILRKVMGHICDCGMGTRRRSPPGKHSLTKQQHIYLVKQNATAFRRIQNEH